MLRKVPLIVILGSTGTGKTKLSVELARRFNAEIISADSMQVYRGLSIATAKATNDERSQAPHHMLDVATPNEPFTVTHFRDLALPIIDNLLQSSKIPIIVGGTNYYIESILWHNLVSPGIGKRKIINDDDDGDDGGARSGLEQEVKDLIADPSMADKMREMESSRLHEYLKLIDSKMANRIHPNNKRKIMRALEVFKDHGKMSEIIEDQRQLPGGPQRYDNVIIFWLQCDQETLNQRLDGRVDSMVRDGLLAEIRNFHDEFVNKCNVDYEKGILQTIGFKEFIPYLKTFDKRHDMLINRFVEHPETTPEPDGWKSLVICLEDLKTVTRRYSKRQLKWIRNRFLGSELRKIPPVYPLDTSDVSRWEELVSQPALSTVESYINSEPIQLKPCDKVRRLAEGLDDETSHNCEICNRVFIGDYQWQLHQKSNVHKRACAGKRRKEKLQEKLNEKTSS